MADLHQIITKLSVLEPISRQLEPDAPQRGQWMESLHAYSEAFLDHIHELPAFVDDAFDAARFDDLAIPPQGRPLTDLLQVLGDRVDKPGLNPASGGHLGYIPGGGLFPSAMGDYLSAIFNRYAGLYFGSPGAVQLENHLIDWMRQLFGMPAGTLGNLASGGSIANLTAIVAARESRQITPDNVRQQVIYTTKQVHHCIDKALRIAGLHHAERRIVPMDNRSRMDMAALRAIIAEDKQQGLAPMLLVASAGTTDTGAIDPLAEAAVVARTEGMWYHIDAAYGGFFILTDFGREALQGIEQADSLVVDPHKGLFLPYGTGAVLVRDGAALYNSHYYQASYLQDTLLEGAPFSPADLSPELTKHFRGLRMWLPLQLFGTDKFAKALEEKRLLALYFTERVQQLPGFEIAHEPDLSVVLFRYTATTEDANAYNARLVKSIHRDGRVFVSSTTVAGTFWLHLAVLSFRTHRDTIDTLITVLEELTAR